MARVSMEIPLKGTNIMDVRTQALKDRGEDADNDVEDIDMVNEELELNHDLAQRTENLIQ